MKQVSKLIIWRDSVCAGDDCDAPHERQLLAAPDMTLRQIAAQLLDGSYLASISGGEATWILEGRLPLLVFAQQWTEPRFLASPDSLLAACIRPDGRPHLKFEYWCQADPARVFECIELGKPLPDKYGR